MVTASKKPAVKKDTQSKSPLGNKFYEDLFNKVPSAIAVYEVKKNGSEFIFKDFNRTAEKIEGLKKSQLLGKNIKEIFPGVEKMGLIKVFKEVYRTGKKKYFEPTKYEDDQKVFWRENYIYKLPTGEIVALYNDVTAEMETQEQLKEKVEDLEKFNKLMVSRELKMIELKEALRKLAIETGHLKPKKDRDEN